MATFDECAVWLVDNGHYRRHEQGRRRARVLAENFAYLEYAYLEENGSAVFDQTGRPTHLVRVNDSGRDANLMRVTGLGRMEVARRVNEIGV
jgi:hypothetical protein